MLKMYTTLRSQWYQGSDTRFIYKVPRWLSHKIPRSYFHISIHVPLPFYTLPPYETFDHRSSIVFGDVFPWASPRSKRVILDDGTDTAFDAAAYQIKTDTIAIPIDAAAPAKTDVDIDLIPDCTL